MYLEKHHMYVAHHKIVNNVLLLYNHKLWFGPSVSSTCIKCWRGRDPGNQGKINFQTQQWEEMFHIHILMLMRIPINLQRLAVRYWQHWQRKTRVQTTNWCGQGV